MAVTIGVDLGTTHCKAVALAPDGEVMARANGRYPLHTPHSHWAAQDVEEIWQAVTAILQQVATQLQSQQIVALGLSGAMHSLLPVQASGAPLARAMTWADGRATAQTEKLRQETDSHVLYRRTGCPLQSTYHLPRLRWFQEEGIEATYFVAIKDWVMRRLTGRWTTDWALASSTGLFDIHKRQWDEEALALAGIDTAQLPTLLAPQAMAGGLLERVADAVGLPAGLPVVAGGSDGGLANVGAGAVRPGQVVVTVGTSGAVRRVVERPLLDDAARTWCYVLAAERWFAGGAINNGGLALEWMRERFYPDLPETAAYQQLMADAATTPLGADGVLLLPYFTGERSPHWDAEASATLHGLKMNHTRAHIARAVLEGVAFCLADVWQALHDSREMTSLAEAVRLTGGITRSRLWAQIVADVLGVTLAVHDVADASAVGAAMLAYWGTGRIDALEEMAPDFSSATLVEPHAARHTQYARIHDRFQALRQKIESSA